MTDKSANAHFAETYDAHTETVGNLKIFKTLPRRHQRLMYLDKNGGRGYEIQWRECENYWGVCYWGHISMISYQHSYVVFEIWR